MNIEDFGEPPTLIYFDTSRFATAVDREDTDYGEIGSRELEILLSLLTYSASKVRRELRRRVGRPR